MAGPRSPVTSLLAALVQRPLVTASILLGCAAAGGLQPVLHEREPVAEAVVLLAESTAEQVEVDSRAFVRSQAAIARLPLATSLTAAAADAAHPDADVDAAAVARGLRVTLAPGETGLVFRMRHRDADVATYAADAAAYSYQRIRRAQLRAEATATVRRLDALIRSLSALPAGLARENAQEALAEQRAAALVQQVEPDLGIVAAVPAELDARRARAPVSAMAGLLAGVVPALVVGHALRTRDLALATMVRGSTERARQRFDLGGRRPVPADVVAEVIHDRAGGPQTLAVLWRGSDALPRPLAALALQPHLRLVPLVLGRSAALTSLRGAVAGVAVVRRGRHELDDAVAIREILDAVDVPLDLEVRLAGRADVLARRWKRSLLRRRRPPRRPALLDGVA